MRPPVGGLIARASFPAAPHQAAGGWHPAPLHSWPKGRRPFRESPRRRPDPWWPLQISERLPLVPLDISCPAQFGSPLLPVTTRRPDAITHCGGFRSGEQYKSELKRGPVSGQARPGTVSVLTEEFSGFLVDEMKPGAGEADDGHIRIGTGVVRRGLRKPMLHVRAQPWAFEKDMPAHRREYAELARRVTSVCLRSRGCLGGISHGRREAIAGDLSAELATARLPAQHPLRRKRPPAEAASLFSLAIVYRPVRDLFRSRADVDAGAHTLLPCPVAFFRALGQTDALVVRAPHWRRLSGMRRNNPD